MQERMAKAGSEVERESITDAIRRRREINKLMEINEKREHELQQLQQKIAERETLFAEREGKLVERQRHFEMQLRAREAESEALRNHLQGEITRREAQLQEAQVELQQEKQRYNEESRRRIERTSQDYVADALNLLDRKEKQLHGFAMGWAFLGAIALIAGIALFVYVSFDSVRAMPASVSWEFIVFALGKGAIAIALLAGLARYAFLFSNSYMREALKNGDRTHAINFGKFYLQSYGAAADWTQVKDAFANWNTTGSNAFTQNGDMNVDIGTMERTASLLEKAIKSLPNGTAAKS